MFLYLTVGQTDYSSPNLQVFLQSHAVTCQLEGFLLYWNTHASRMCSSTGSGFCNGVGSD